MEEVEKRGREVESIRVPEEVEEIPGKEPTAASATLIGEDGFEVFTLSHAVDEVGEIDP